jgi:uncharacterized protein YecT (DUF1311 family)
MQSFMVKLVTIVLALAPGAVSFAKDVTKTQPTCRQDEKLFRGQCVAPDACCVPGVCDSGEVFVFGEDGPRCFSCAKVDTQQPMNFCASEARGAADHDLDLERKAFLKRFPQRAARVAVVEKAWQIFRERSCTLEASEYEGGSMQPQVYDECMAREARSHLERLKALRTEWSKH